MTYPDNLITSHGGPLHRYLFVHKAHDIFAAALGRWPSKREIILSEAMVDIRLWDARTVWYANKAYQRKARVEGPFIVSHISVEIGSCSDDKAVIVVYGEHHAGRVRRLRAHYCWPTEELAHQHANLLNEKTS